MDKKQLLLDLYDLTGREMQAFATRLTPEELEACGTAERWESKETFAHMAIWQERLQGNIQAALSGGTPVHYENYLELNDQDFIRCQEMSWEQAWGRASASFQALQAQLEALAESDLERQDLLPWQERPLWRTLVGTGSEHISSHLALLYSQHGLGEEAIRLQETIAQATLVLDDSPDWQGVVRYNLACVQALSGRKDQALAGLKEALRLNPSLTEWSKQDSDLDSLREESGYKALYEGAEG